MTRKLPLIGDRLPPLALFKDPTQYKHLYAWFRSREKNYLLEQRIPWLTFDAIDFLKNRTSVGCKVFEYGSGSSTLFWASFNAHCTSIEHDPAWYTVIQDWLAAINNVDIRLVPPDPESVTNSGEDIDNPLNYRSSAVGFRQSTFRNYVSQIDGFPDGSFDVVLIDGRARPSCIMHSVGKVKSGGMLIVDNANVPRYLAQTGRYLEHFRLRRFRGIGPIDGAITQTNVYIAP